MPLKIPTSRQIDEGVMNQSGRQSFLESDVD